MFHIYQSNRLEVLADRLAELIRRPLGSPFVPELIVVQSNGLARWLALRLADRLGISACIDFQFPATFLWNVAGRVLGSLPQRAAFDRKVLCWRIMAQLADLDEEEDPRFAPIRAWLGDDRDDFRRYELAYRIAECFDQYLVYRPDWIARWEAGYDGHWQAELWRRLIHQELIHRVRIYEDLRATLRNSTAPSSRLPERVSLIGLSALPPLYIDLLAELGQCTEVHLFLMNPCQEYWGDICAERDLARLGETIDPEAEYLTVGHPLLASLGKQGRDFIDLLQNWPRVEEEYFVEPDGDNLLHHLQADILHLRERGTPNCPPLLLHPNDCSLQVHACHGPMREVEVLHDQLLALLETYPELRPADIVVMAPDIAQYGPLIEAVFGTAPPERRIPFSIADQGLPVEHPLIEGFFALLDLSGKRFDAVQVLGLLEAPALRRRFHLSEDDIERIHRWVREVGIRWGINAGIKSDWDLPATAEHTWQSGLDRLFLGYALPGQGRELYCGILPYDEIEGAEAQALGGLRRFLDELFNLHHAVRQPRPPGEWTTLLYGVVDRFFDPREQEENEVQLIRRALETLGEETEQAQFVEPISLAVMKSALRNQLNTPESGVGQFLGKGVTFCAMVPMRSIPFAAVCLLGMNDDAYPRPHQPVGFDLMANSFRRGDRCRRRDDRYLFLEALLSARRCFYLSYVGQNIRDNTTLPPSVLVSELLDVIDRSFVTADGQRPSDCLVLRHPLQPFSQRYFTGDSRLFSYAQEWVGASRFSGCGEREATALLTAALPEPEPALRWVTLEGLTQFFKNPTRWLLRERLGIQVEEEGEVLETREPFVPSALESYQVLDQMLELYQEKKEQTDIETIVRASGALPHGQVGKCFFERAYERVERFAGRLGDVFPRRGGQVLRELDGVIGKFRVTGRLTGMTQAGWVGYRLAKMKAADYLKLWLHHLVINALGVENEDQLYSRWLAEDRLVTLTPVEQPKAVLQDMLNLYWQGTQRLIHFFPKSALAYVEQLRRDREPNPEKALWAARQVWEGLDWQPGTAEREDAYYRLAFRGTDPLDEEFITLSRAVFEPLFAQIQIETAEDV